MEELIIQIGPKTQNIRNLFRSKEDSISVGRNFDNNLVLSDPHIGPHQLHFERQDDLWLMHIIDDTNPVLVNRKTIKTKTHEIHPGDTITIGRTQLHTFVSDMPLPETQKIQFSQLTNQPFVLFGITCFVLVAMALLNFIESYMISTQEFDWKDAIESVVAITLLILAWAGTWSLMGRLLKHQANFLLHILLVSLILVLFTLAFTATEYLEYFSGSTLLTLFVSYSLIFILISLLFYWDLTLSTNLKKLKTISSITAIGILFSSFIFNDLRKNEHTPSLSLLLKPPYIDLASSKSKTQFINTLNEKSNTAFTQEIERGNTNNPKDVAYSKGTSD